MMKKKIFMVMAFIAFTVIMGSVYAQVSETLRTRTKSNQSNERPISENGGTVIVKLTKADAGCYIIFDYRLKPKDTTIKLSAGRMAQPPVKTKRFDISATDKAVTETMGMGDMPSDKAKGKSAGMGMGKGMYEWIKTSFNKGLQLTRYP